MDHCMHCVARGNIKECEQTPCGVHDSWYVQEKFKDASRYGWLRDNITSAEIRGDLGFWIRKDGSRFVPGCYCAFNDCAYGGYTLDEAIDLAMQEGDR